MHYPVNEIFHTIQGEARYTGTAAVFVRLQGCPVGCAWCDTKHTWDQATAQTTIPVHDMLIKSSDDDRSATMSTDDILEVVKHLNGRHVVITGGEPCLYDLGPISTALHNAGIMVQIETSGTHSIHCDNRTWVTVSPKLGMPGGLEVRYDALCRANEIKLPVGKTEDIRLALAYKSTIKPDSDIRIWLQPLSQSTKATELCIEAAKQHGFKLSAQTHKYLGVR